MDRPKRSRATNLKPDTDMALAVGTKAPDFTLTTMGANGPELWQLSGHLGQGNLVLLFVPMAFTSVCSKELCQISQGLNDYTALNATVVGISGDNPFAQQNWAQKEAITIPLLSDYEHQVARAYGVAYDSFLPAKNLTMGGVPKRSAFVIDRAGVVQYAESSDDPGKLPDFEAIKAKLGELR
jgi:glutaredoxin-dependent peroxiredoxin